MFWLWSLYPAALAGDASFVLSPELSLEEQVALEHLNALRHATAPAVEGWRASLEGLECERPDRVLRGLTDVSPRPPLVPHQTLMSLARDRAEEMVDQAYFGHVDPQGYGPNQRLLLRGYPLPVQVPLRLSGRSVIFSSQTRANEVEAIYQLDRGPSDVAFGATDWIQALDALVLDTCVKVRVNRQHLLGLGALSSEYRDVGLGSYQTAAIEGDRHRVFVVEAAVRRGESGTGAIQGVVYVDRDGDGAYDLGEGVVGIKVEVEGRAWTLTTSGGGYVLPVPPWKGTIRCGDQVRDVVSTGVNQKFDFVLSEAQLPKPEPPPPSTPPSEELPLGLILGAVGAALTALGGLVGFRLMMGASFGSSQVLRVAPDEFSLRESAPIYLHRIEGGRGAMMRAARLGLGKGGEVVQAPQLPIAFLEASGGGEVLLDPVGLIESLDERTGNWSPVARGRMLPGRIYGAEDVLFLLEDLNGS
ncbi:MAG: hypothetical protein JXX28_01380 [Deltaproteobacteria bacterium]|nr:hypothetical protein [Deltaproteobacteria bacterium]